MSYIWTKSDIGCHIDGAFGLKHGTNRVRALVQQTAEANGCSADWLIANLSEDYDKGTDWASDDALEYLQAQTAPGLIWNWASGDLILMDESEAASC